ncbi:unnamed protein product [Schistosoma mattheei]|uniref:Uncharacterized protein n=1 Tax=Schistosoma mattheei TaxID=31246 RepID=A0A183Q313_9TREM|nr:unnamed protein product [Schistosoma mattheei]
MDELDATKRFGLRRCPGTSISYTSTNAGPDSSVSGASVSVGDNIHMEKARSSTTTQRTQTKSHLIKMLWRSCTLSHILVASSLKLYDLIAGRSGPQEASSQGMDLYRNTEQNRRKEEQEEDLGEGTIADGVERTPHQESKERRCEQMWKVQRHHITVSTRESLRQCFAGSDERRSRRLTSRSTSWIS